MIEHVYRRAAAASSVGEVIVATDDLRIATRVNEFGGRVRLTKATHQSGTDRLAEIVAGMDVDIVVNVQGDEPLIDPRAIDQVVAPLLADSSIQMSTLYKRITQPAELIDNNVVKMVVDRGGFAMYFSRAPIPHVRDPRGGWPPLYRHIGLYAYRRNALLVLASLEPTPLERAESLEQLLAEEEPDVDPYAEVSDDEDELTRRGDEDEPRAGRLIEDDEAGLPDLYAGLAAAYRRLPRVEDRTGGLPGDRHSY